MQTIVDGYTIGDPIGVGGFSTVYRATQEQFDRDVALKVLNIRLDDPRSVQRFHNECLALGRLDFHPHIADIYAAGLSESGTPYIAMRWYRRGSLADMLAARGDLPADQVLAVGLQMADALQAAHELGIVHRDVKPQNILVSDRGDFALSDFGVSVLEYENGGTVTQAFTYDHAAPEVLESETFGPASDQYALASTLYTLSVGHVPFNVSAPAAQIKAIIETDPDFADPRLRVLAPVLSRAMAKDPQARYSDMAAFAQALVDAHEQQGLEVPDHRPMTARDGEFAAGARSARGWTDSAGTRGSNTRGQVLTDSFTSIAPGWTRPGVAAGVLVLATLITAIVRGLMFAIKGIGVPIDGEWLSFQSGVFLFGSVVAATFIVTRGPLRAFGYGAALYILASRFKIACSSLMTSIQEDRIVAVYSWIALILVLTAATALVGLSAWRHRTSLAPVPASLAARWIMVGTAIGAGAYTFWTWSGTIRDVVDLTLLVVYVGIAVAFTLWTITMAWRSNTRFGIYGYALSFFALHAIWLLGVSFNLTSAPHRMWYELSLLVALGAASLCAYIACYRTGYSRPSVDVRDSAALTFIPPNRK